MDRIEYFSLLPKLRLINISASVQCSHMNAFVVYFRLLAQPIYNIFRHCSCPAAELTIKKTSYVCALNNKFCSENKNILHD